MTDEYQGKHEAEAVEEPVIGDAPPTAKTLFSNRVYDWLKFIEQLLLPALAVFYISVAPLWGLPKQEEVAGTLMALDLLLGAILNRSAKQYSESDARFDGVMVVADRKNSLILNEDVEVLEKKKELVFRVETPQ